MIGTILNTLSVLIGGALGTWLGNRFPPRLQETILAALGLFSLAIGVQSALLTGNPLLPLAGLLLGGMLGEWWQIEKKLERLAEWLRGRFAPTGESGRFVEGFVTASLVFCVGPLMILGAIEDGLTGDYTKLALKAVLDLFSSIAFAASLGIGVMASAAAVLVVQGGIALLAMWAGAGLFSEPMIAEMSAAGGIVLLSIGFRLLNVARIRSANLLPALFLAPLLVALLDLLGVVYYF